MNNSKNLLILILILSLSSCYKEVISPLEYNLPEKLAPYETFFDLPTIQSRRENLMNKLPVNALVLIVTNDTYLRNGNVNYDFRPTSNFYYLTGFDEPNAVAVIRRNQAEANTIEFIMFVEERDSRMAQWLGPVYGPEGAIEYFGADSAYAFGKFGSQIKSYLSSGSYQSVYTNLEDNPSVCDSFYNAIIDTPAIYDLDGLTYDLRAIKSEIEINALREAINVSVQAFGEAAKRIGHGVYEYEVEATFDYILGLNGCPSTAFPTIVASGPNINILHYQANQRQMLGGELVMIDFGAEYGYYAADITRTFPVNGKFSPQQANVYNIVLEAHRAAIRGAAPGVNYYDLYAMVIDYIVEQLLAKGIVYGEKSQIISSGTYRQYIPAGLAHCIGLDVHDPFPQIRPVEKILQENMVLAFEPHIYLYEGDQTVNPDYWNISARIEDDVLITSSGYEVLSNRLPNEISALEQLMK
ncbi:MAG: aminopeptidase P N-terminal domain-containing protein [bacterium]|nr:MAG: aminopeptidase P N-terminal domain-containing protein [bacterium]